MGEHERWAEASSGLLPNGLLPNEAASVIRALDAERWSKAEERTAELIACIQPNQPSEERRNAVAHYVQRLISKCFPCEVFTFGSVPLKTYLPDGDIDLTAFSKNQNLKDSWAHQVRDMLENEEKNDNAEFRVKEVQYIQAEVKIIKCLVENIVVDISFNQLGGLCTLCFLEEVDNLINQNHLFKRSIILIKAWCYYESRILGAHHGLISTYALETLVLYIFHVFNNSFAGPLEVLYRFLEFFSKFDWDNFCVSLWGPVPISSLPDVTAEPPRKDGGELLLSKLFLDACSAVYAVYPVGQENQGQPFISKHFNVIDPLRINNNLGRSVSKGNFFRIRSAFAFGAKRLARLLDCPEEDLHYEVNQFFMNTWDRHGSGQRPDAPKNGLRRLILTNPDHTNGSEHYRNNSNAKTPSCETQVDAHSSRSVSSQHGTYPTESTTRSSEVAAVSRGQTQKTYVNSTSTRMSDQSRRESDSSQGAYADKSQKSSKPDNLGNDLQGRYIFARTRSSPELTDAYTEVPSQGRHNRASEGGKGQTSSTRLDTNRRKKPESDNLIGHYLRSPIDDSSGVRQNPSHQNLDATAGSSNNYYDDHGLDAMGEEVASMMGTLIMQQEEQDRVNMMASSAGHGFNGQAHVPLNLASSHVPFPLPPSVLASMHYAQRNLGGMIPTNIPMMEAPWGTNMQFPQGLVPSSLTHYFPDVALTSNLEDPSEPSNENFGHTELNTVETEHDPWLEKERGSHVGFDLDNGGFETHQSDEKQQSSYNFVPSSHMGVYNSSARVQQKFTKECRTATRENVPFSYQENKGSEVYSDERIDSSRSFPASHSSSLRSKTSSESSWEGSSAKSSKSTREKRGRKTSSVPSVVYGKGKTVCDHLSNQTDDDNKDWNVVSATAPEMTERNIGPQSTALRVLRHQTSGFDTAQTSASESLIPIAPMLLGPGSQQRNADNSGVVPFTFYPTGPPVPFVTMLPVYNFPNEQGTSDAPGQFSVEEIPDNSDSGQNFESAEGLDQAEVLSSDSTRRVASVEPLEHKSDILNSDFASHWQNLQYGRFCQNSPHPTSVIYPSPVIVPPAYWQGRFPWDGPGRPVSTNMNLFTQLMSSGPRLVPVTPLQSVSGRSPGVYQQYVEEMPRYRSGTGTYLPNPKVSVRDRHSTGNRKGNYNYEKSEHHGDREANWSVNSKSRSTGRNHNRSQAEKSSSRADRLATSENRADRSWGSHRHGAFHSHQSQNGPLRPNSTQSSSTNVAYGMYPIQSINPGGVSTNGPTIPSVVMLYPYDHNSGYSSAADQLEFGSLGPLGFPASHFNEANRSSSGFEDQRFHGNAAQRSSPDQPSSPHLQSKNFNHSTTSAWLKTILLGLSC
ncbi:hypothetical protein K2173_025321 [Erythroxylum novogranatense]|uniref:Polymerase nucleotidyl transferase domain-containing protein n=1 Tax=Erythroxylum novogranatense TaxID=1862640 RepID=A0AAV8UDH6_9ROSI|nr:hypothetical protein K2173_025321 [Erythroxylum novogranatense]